MEPIQRGLPAATYYDAAGVSKSMLDRIARSPAHFHHAMQGGFYNGTDTPTFLRGRALHALALEGPDAFTSGFTIPPSFGRSKADTEARARWEAANAHKSKLAPAHGPQVSGMLQALRASPVASQLLFDELGEPELSLFWDESGTACKCRIDRWLPKRRIIVDLKTSADASPEAFARSAGRYRYHVQAGWYWRAATAVGLNPRAFVFVAVEPEPPHGVGVYALTQDDRKAGEYVALRDLAKLQRCIADGDWPSYTTRIETIEIPRYFLNDDDEVDE